MLLKANLKTVGNRILLIGIIIEIVIFASGQFPSMFALLFILVGFSLIFLGLYYKFFPEKIQKDTRKQLKKN